MSKKRAISESFDVVITGIKVSEGCFSFHYEVDCDGAYLESGIYESSHSWSDLDEWRAVLERGEAVKLALMHALD